jgi:hypothetical protein
MRVASAAARAHSRLPLTGRLRRQLAVLAAATLAAGTGLAIAVASAPAAADTTSLCPDANVAAFGPNVCVFSDSMSQAAIQQDVNAIAAQQVSNQFGTQRYALLFEPGTYGSAADPLSFQVGYYTSVAGLGASPTNVVINGAVDSFNQCDPTGCFALSNFWRSLSNLTINVMASPSLGGCQGSAEFWATSQASPVRRVDIRGGNVTLFDYCSGPGYSSGGFIADSQFTGGAVINGTQQQFIARNSNIDNWTNSVWNQVFAGDVGAPAPEFLGNGKQVTTLATSPVTQEEPFLQVGGDGKYSVFVPAVQVNSVGPSWTSGTTAGEALAIEKFFIASPATPVSTINQELAHGKDLILTPGVYALDQPIQVNRPNTIVLGLGFATLVPQDGTSAMVVANVPGVKLSGMIFDAGPVDSPVLLQVGQTSGDQGSSSTDPTLLQDVFFRIGGATPGQADTSLLVNSSHVILDDIWAWRADHGNGVGWTDNVGKTGVVVNGDDVTAYGLFAEHFEQSAVVWNGQNGTDIFFQNELPYDPPNQAAWMASPSQDGYPAFVVSPGVTTFQGYGLGSYVVFIQTPATLFDAEAFQAPDTPGVQFHDVLTVWIAGSGGYNSVINGVGSPATSTNPGKVIPVDVVSYP